MKKKWNWWKISEVSEKIHSIKVGMEQNLIFEVLQWYFFRTVSFWRSSLQTSCVIQEIFFNFQFPAANK